MNELKISARYETAIICSQLHNSSGYAKSAKSPQDLYKNMEIPSIDEQDAKDELMGDTRTYKGSLKSKFEQHTAWLESQKPKE